VLSIVEYQYLLTLINGDLRNKGFKDPTATQDLLNRVYTYSLIKKVFFMIYFFQNTAFTFYFLTIWGTLNYQVGKKASENPSEVDFVWRGKKLIPIECKAALKVSPRSFASLRNYLNESGEKFGVLISAAPFSEHREGNTRLVNLPLYLCEGETILGLV
jgi:hypothetical protein